MDLNRIIPRLLLAVVILVACCPTVFAHGVTVFAWVDGETVMVESKFHGGKRPNGAEVTVFDSHGNQIVKGVTDQQGRFQFTHKSAEDLKIVLYAGAGHQAEWRLTRGEFDSSASEAGNLERESTGEDISERQLDGAIVTLSTSDLEKLVQSAVYKALEEMSYEKKRCPPRMQLDSAQLRDILGGIGYILGLIGLGAYLTYRKRS